MDTRPLAACRCYRKIYDNLDSENGRSPSIFFLIFCCHRFLSQRGNVTPEFVFFIQKITAYAVLFLQTLERVETSAGGTRFLHPATTSTSRVTQMFFLKKKVKPKRGQTKWWWSSSPPSLWTEIISSQIRRGKVVQEPNVRTVSLPLPVYYVPNSTSGAYTDS